VQSRFLLVNGTCAKRLVFGVYLKVGN